MASERIVKEERKPRPEDERVSVVVAADPGAVEGLGEYLTGVAGALEEAGLRHELLLVYETEDDEVVAVADGMEERPEGLRFVRCERHGGAAAVRAGVKAATGDVVVITRGLAEDGAELIVAMVAKVRGSDGGEGAEAVVVRRGGRFWGEGWQRRMANGGLWMLAGVNAHEANGTMGAFAGRFADAVEIESGSDEAVILELVVKAQLGGWRVGEVKGDGAAGGEGRGISAEARGWYRAALGWPVVVWGLWGFLCVAALVAAVGRAGGLGEAAGGVVNAGMLGAGAFAFTLAARRVRGRMRAADGFYSLVLLNPLLYGRAVGCDRTLVGAGLLGLMAGAIIAMKRDSLLRYAAVGGLALGLARLSDAFLFLLPALGVWLLGSGYGMARSGQKGVRIKGFVVMGVGEALALFFGLACLVEEATRTPEPARLFATIVDFVDFPLLVVGIVMLGLGWRKGPGGRVLPHFWGVLALLLGLLTMLVNNFQSGPLAGPGALSGPGADQTVIVVCLVYTVFALHGPRRLRWVMPVVLLAGAVVYTVWR